LLNNLEFLLRNAVLNIVEFDIHTRTEMRTFNRVRPHYVMSYHKKGTAKLRVGGDTYSIVPGTVVLIAPYLEHDHYKDTNDESVFLWCHFTFEIANIIDVLKIFHIPITFKLSNPEQFEQVFLQYKDLISSKELVTETGLQPTAILKKAKELEILYYFLVDALRTYQETTDNVQIQNFLAILTHIIQHPEQEISLESFSKKLNMHPTYISNRFKGLFGKSLTQVQREMRIHKAKTLLNSSEMSVTEIANSIGFQTIPNFTRSFKSSVGLSPSRYREINKKTSTGFSPDFTIL
jgi:AraC family transcriptional regulator of arabinose operon